MTNSAEQEWGAGIIEATAQAEGQQLVGTEYSKDFIDAGRVELADYHISPEEFAKVKRLGGKIVLPPYFTSLFREKSEEETTEEYEISQLVSIATGSVAFGLRECALEAIMILQTLPQEQRESAMDRLISNMDTAIKIEARFGQSGTQERAERLQEVSKYLGKPLPQRFARGVMTALALHAR